MSDWIKKQADGIKKDDERVAENRRWALHAAEQVKLQWKGVWGTVKDAIKADVAEFNAQFPDDARKHIVVEGDGDTTMSFKREDKVVRVIQVSAAAEGINLRIIETDFRSHGQNISHQQIGFGCGRDNSVVSVLLYGNPATPVKASEAILRYLF